METATFPGDVAVPDPRREMTLPDGRTLSFAEYGDPDGAPVLALHGTPGSRLFGALLHDAGQETGVRVVAPDRPGYGGSPFRPFRIADWPDDVAALADHLGLEAFGVLGFSGGGPFALATAADLDDRVAGVAVVGGVAPPAAPYRGLGVGGRLFRALPRYLPWTLAPLFWLALRVARRNGPPQVLGQLTDEPVGDVAVATGTTVADVVYGEFLTALDGGTVGVVRESELFTGPWTFDLADVAPRVHLWHGEADGNVPVSAGRWVADRLPDCEARFVDHDHLGTLVAHREAALSAAAP